ncbi:MAG: TldD/PmbA family protein [Deltaproteobacteria bacterium]|nr:TldD/PmbA family protein [Candidatus Zymogenaceae bacterium]
MNHRERFELLRDRLEGRLASAGVPDWEIYYGASSRLGISAEDGGVEDYSFSAPYGVSLRVINDGGIGFSFATRPDDDALDRMVADSLAGAQHTAKDDRYRFADPAHEIPDVGPLTDEGLEDVPLPEKIERALAIERSALAVDPRVKRVRGARYGEVRATMFLANSLGVDVGYEKTVVSAQTMAMAGDGSDQEMGWDAEFALTAGRIDPERVGRRAGEEAVSRLGAKKAPTCSCAALFVPQAAVDILEVLSSSFLGENVMKGKSMLAKKLGTRVFSEQVTIVDDGLLPGGVATSPVDGEGVPAGTLELISKGVLNGFLYDLVNAARAGVEPTGSAARGGVTAPPTSNVRNFFIKPGDADADALIAGMGTGVIITDLMGVHTADPVTGEFSVGASGFLVENGKKGAPFKEAAIAGDLMTLFSRIIAVGNDLRFYGGTGSPSFVVEGLDVSGE